MPTFEEANCLVATDNQIAVLRDAMDASLSIMTIVDIVGEVIGNPGDVLTDYQLWAIHQKWDNLPPILEQNKDVCVAMQEYAREHLSELSVELMCEYLDETLLPKR